MKMNWMKKRLKKKLQRNPEVYHVAHKKKRAIGPLFFISEFCF